MKSKGGHRFGPGNKAAVGNPGPHQGKTKFLTQALISQLNEYSKSRIITEVKLVKGKPVKTYRYDTETLTKIHLVIERLITNAIDDGDMAAIKEIFDRVEGKVVQAVEGTGDQNVINIRLIPGDDKI